MRHKLIIALEVIAISAAVVAALFIFKHPDRHDDKTANGPASQQPAGLPQRAQACLRYTLADAKQLMGDTAKPGSNPVYESDGANLYTSSCTYAKQISPGQTDGDKTSSTLLMRLPKTDKGTLSNQNEFGPLVPADATQLTGYGDKAFWDPDHGELNILKNDIWYVLSIGPAAPVSRSLDQVKAMADLLLPKL